MFAAPNSTTVTWTFIDLVTDATTSGTFSSDIPAASLGLAPRGWISVGGTSSVIGMTLMSLYIESDF